MRNNEHLIAMKMTELSVVMTPSELDAIRTWLQYKAEKRQTYKPIGFAYLVKKLIKIHDQHGANAVVAAIEHSMECNYQGIYMPKNSVSNVVREGDDMSEINEKLNSLDLEDL